jgi:hypothetical protein
VFGSRRRDVVAGDERHEAVAAVVDVLAAGAGDLTDLLRHGVGVLAVAHERPAEPGLADRLLGEDVVLGDERLGLGVPRTEERGVHDVLHTGGPRRIDRVSVLRAASRPDEHRRDHEQPVPAGEGADEGVGVAVVGIPGVGSALPPAGERLLVAARDDEPRGVDPLDEDLGDAVAHVAADAGHDVRRRHHSTPHSAANWSW